MNCAIICIIAGDRVHEQAWSIRGLRGNEDLHSVRPPDMSRATTNSAQMLKSPITRR